MVATQPGTAAIYETFVRGITYVDEAAEPVPGARTISLVVNDGLHQSNTVTVTDSVADGFYIDNFFGNIGDAWSAVNLLLQGRFKAGVEQGMRFAVNSTFGLAGLIDVATPAGLPKHVEDFGQTLGKWGVKSGPYLMLPLFGASTVRDGLARPLDIYADALNQIPGPANRNIGRVLRFIDDRSNLLGASSLMEDAALDPYQFLRDAYLQRRESRVRDGADPAD
jgi:phospholipid-binding lipoprotein MlaA